MLGMGLRAFDATAYDPVRGLLWFAAVVVLGADSVLGALLAAALLVGLDAGARGGVAAALIGVLAVLVGRFPEGPYEALRAATSRLRLHRGATLTPLGARVRRNLRPAAEARPAALVPQAPTGATEATAPAHLDRRRPRTSGRPRPASPGSPASRRPGQDAHGPGSPPDPRRPARGAHPARQPRPGPASAAPGAGPPPAVPAGPPAPPWRPSLLADPA